MATIVDPELERKAKAELERLNQEARRKAEGLEEGSEVEVVSQVEVIGRAPGVKKNLQQKAEVDRLQQMYDQPSPEEDKQIEPERNEPDEPTAREEDENEEENNSEETPEEQNKSEEESPVDKSAEYAKNLAEEQAKDQLKKVAVQQAEKAVAKEAVAAGGTAVATGAGSIIGVPALIIMGVILVIFIIALLIPIFLTVACNQDGLSGSVIRGANYVSSKLGLTPDICGPFTIEYPDVAAPDPNATGPLPPGLVNIPVGLYSVSNFSPTVSGDFPKVKPSLLPLINQVFSLAQAQGLTVIITSAARTSPPFNFSCHVLGEAVDFVLIPSAPPADIDALVAIGQTVGFGFVLDEYRNPSPSATGPHVHMGLTSAPNCSGRST
jgi:hypothetical protein